MDLLYPRFCTRKDIVREIVASRSAPLGAEGALYPGSCRKLSAAECDDQPVAGTRECFAHDALPRWEARFSS